MTIGIYKIQSKIKPYRIYIGSSVNIFKRWKQHLNKLRKNEHHSRKLQRHYNKYGINDLQFYILKECNKDELISIEQLYIDTIFPYFNICKIANIPTPVIMTDEIRKKISNSTQGRVPWNRGIPRTPEEKAKMSVWQKGRTKYPCTEDRKKKLSIIFKGKPLPEETKKRMREGWELRRLRMNKPKSKYLIKKYGT